MSTFSSIVLGVFILYIIFSSWKKFLQKENKQNHEELLRFFAEDELLTIHELSQKISDRTEGRRKMSDSSLYIACKALVSQGKLVLHEEEVSLPDGSCLRKRRYGLAKPSSV